MSVQSAALYTRSLPAYIGPVEKKVIKKLSLLQINMLRRLIYHSLRRVLPDADPS